MKLKENALAKCLEALGKRTAEVVSAIDGGRDLEVVELMQNGLLTYEDLVEPSKLNLEDEFWSCCSPEEIKEQHEELDNILEEIQADKIGSASQDTALMLAVKKISASTSKALFYLIEDYLNNKKEYEV